MRIGWALPQHGPIAGPASLRRVAARAEELGVDSLWVGERLLWPVAPQAPYPGSADGRLPETFQEELDPLDTLAFVAAHTRRVRLGTSVINLPLYPPLMLARRAATLDVLSAGRLMLGFGHGWLPDEFDAMGVPMKDRLRRSDAHLRALKAIWTTDPVEIDDQPYVRVSRSLIRPKPVQKPHPPVYLAAFAPAAMERVARDADGWNPAGIPVPRMAAAWSGIRARAEALGRDPGCLELVVRANLHLLERPLGAQRPAFAGTLDQIRADIEGTRDSGAHELFFDAQFSAGVASLDAQLSELERFLELSRTS